MKISGSLLHEHWATQTTPTDPAERQRNNLLQLEHSIQHKMATSRYNDIILLMIITLFTAKQRNLK